MLEAAAEAATGQRIMVCTEEYWCVGLAKHAARPVPGRTGHTLCMVLVKFMNGSCLN